MRFALATRDGDETWRVVVVVAIQAMAGSTIQLAMAALAVVAAALAVVAAALEQAVVQAVPDQQPIGTTEEVVQVAS